MPDAVRLGGICQFGGRETVDPIVGLLGNLRSGVRDTRQVNHRLDIPEQRPPFDRTSQVGDGDDLDRARKNIRRLSHRCPHRMSRVGKFVDKNASDKPRCTRHKYARHDVPRGETATEPTNCCETYRMWQVTLDKGLWAEQMGSFCQNLRTPIKVLPLKLGLFAKIRKFGWCCGNIILVYSASDALGVLYFT